MEIKDVEKLAALARISLSDAEKPKLLAEMNNILAYVEQINSAVSSTSNSGPANTSTQAISNDSANTSVNSQPTNVMRDDVVTTEGGSYTEALVNAAPSHLDGYIKVKKILGGSQ